MATSEEQIRNEIEDLVGEGELLVLLETLTANPSLVDEYNSQQPEGGKKFTKRGLEKATKGESFGERYQRWYSVSLRVVAQVLPDRLSEFVELYKPKKAPVHFTVTNYSISDYALGTTMSSFDSAAVAMSRLRGQVNILSSAKSRLESFLNDMVGTLEYELIEDEIQSARELLKAGYFRASGVMAGVMLERHLKRLIGNRGIAFKKKPQIGNLNDALKAGGAYDQIQWREIQRLGDLRNICGHDGDVEPTRKNVAELIDGVARIVATVN